MENVEIVLGKGAYMPTKEYNETGAYDLKIPEEIIVPCGRSVIPLNFQMKLPLGYGAFVFARSGMSCKGLKGYNIYDHESERRFNCDVLLGLIDCDYRGVCGVLVNNKDMQFKLKGGDDIAQMAIVKLESVNMVQVEKIDMDTERGKKGFNS